MSEFWTVVLAVPVVLAFFPWGGAEVVHRGMQALASSPDFMKWAVGAAITLAFGIRGVHTGLTAAGKLSPSSKEPTTPETAG
jgi:hypothetical protein